MLRDIIMIGISIIFIVGIITVTGVRDESIQPNRFDCRLLIGGWHPDVPTTIAEECRKGVANGTNSKTSYR